LQVVLPRPGEVWKPREKEDQMLTHYNNDCMDRFVVGCNKRPRWDAAAGGHTLNFRGRVTEKSVKNFQIKCNDISGEDTVLQFGRVDKNKFTMDFGYPLSPLQAFAICLASLDGKVSDSSALNGVKKGVRRMSSGASWVASKFRRDNREDEGGEGGEQKTGGQRTGEQRTGEQRTGEQKTGGHTKKGDGKKGQEAMIKSDKDEQRMNNEKQLKNIAATTSSGGGGGNSGVESKTSPIAIKATTEGNGQLGIQKKDVPIVVATIITTTDFPLVDEDDEDEEEPVPPRPNRKSNKK